MNVLPSIIYEFGPYRLEPNQRRLLQDNVEIRLSPRVFDLLVFLVEYNGQIVSKKQLLDSVWAGGNVEEGVIPVTIKALREKLEQEDYIEAIPTRGYRFTAEVKRESVLSWPSGSSANPPTPGGAIPLGSPFYIVRGTDEQFCQALTRRDSVVLVKGPPQVGKTSLLARGAQHARDAGAVVVSTHLRPVELSQQTGSDKLLLHLAVEIAEEIADKLGIQTKPQETWNSFLSPSSNFQRYLQRQVLEKIPQSLVWVIDDVDELFKCGFRDEIFGMFRWWHNLRALEPAGPWQRLTLALAYATEAHLFITDLNQSPFNVGTRLQLEDFTLAQTADLNQRYGALMRDQSEVERFFALLGGHPYLVQQGLYEMWLHKLDLAAIEAKADYEEGIFGNHLRRIWALLERDPGLCEAMRNVLQGNQQPAGRAGQSSVITTGSFYRLRSAGILSGDSPADAAPRCELYARYLHKRLS